MPNSKFRRVFHNFVGHDIDEDTELQNEGEVYKVDEMVIISNPKCLAVLVLWCLLEFATDSYTMRTNDNRHQRYASHFHAAFHDLDLYKILVVGHFGILSLTQVDGLYLCYIQLTWSLELVLPRL